MAEEIKAAAPLAKGKTVSTVFFGGGTPSIAKSQELWKIMDLMRSAFSFNSQTEITLEANPGTLTREKLQDYCSMGVNRLSIGCQSVHDRELQMLGRIHTFREFRESYEMARESGFENVNVDLMSGLPEQTRKSWQESLICIASLAPEHISAYSLIVEEGTPFYERDLKLPDEDTERAMYEETGEILADFGYDQYEISNYGKPGFACKHNVGYWKRENYLGLGLGAASLFDEVRFTNERNMEIYLRDSGNLSAIRKERQELNEQEQMEETMFLGLRMMEGVSKREFQEKFGKAVEQVYGPVLKKYISQGFLQDDGSYVRFTRKGIHVSNYILSDFLF